MNIGGPEKLSLGNAQGDNYTRIYYADALFHVKGVGGGFVEWNKGGTT